MTFTDAAAYFFLYSFVGFTLEVIYAALVLGKFVNRGFLNGPWCPIYGSGVVTVAFLLKPLAGNLPALFVGAIAVATLLELVTGFILERVFGLKWWDYSDERFNLGGYICLKFSLLWGVGCALVVKLLLPLTDLLLAILPQTALTVVLTALALLMTADLAATVASVVGLKRKLRLIDGIAARLHEHSDGYGERVSEETLVLVESISRSRLMRAFPRLEARLTESFHSK